MAEISSLSSVSQVERAHQMQRKSQQRKEHRLEAEKLEASLDQENLSKFEEVQLSDNTFFETSVAIPLEEFNISEMFTTPAQLANFAGKYIAFAEIEYIYNLIENGSLKKRNTLDVANSLTECTSDKEDEILNKFLTNLKNLGGTEIDIYVALLGVLDLLRAKKKKEELQKRIARLIAEYETQESGLFTQFASIVELSKKQPSLVKYNIGALTNLANNRVNVGSILNTLKFIKKNFPHKVTNLVSLYMKLHAKLISEFVGSGALNPEAKARIVNVLSLESSLIQINSGSKYASIFMDSWNQTQKTGAK